MCNAREQRGGGEHGGAACSRNGQQQTRRATAAAAQQQQQQESDAGVGAHRHGCGGSGGCGKYALDMRGIRWA